MSVQPANHAFSATQKQQVSGTAQAAVSAAFYSILFDRPEDSIAIDRQTMPDCFTDLNLDQVVASITAGRDEYNLKPFFFSPLRRVSSISFRHDVFRDLEHPVLFDHIQSFANEMRQMRGHLAQVEKLYHRCQQQSWFLDAVEIYCVAVKGLCHHMTLIDLSSAGFIALRGFLIAYTSAEDFRTLVAETEKVGAALRAIRYSLRIQGKRIAVMKYDPLADYSAEVLQTFERFRQSASKEYRFGLSSDPNMNRVEAAVLGLVAQVYPEIFQSLDEYCEHHHTFLHDTIARFDREVQFYIACLEYTRRFEQVGLSFCYPAVHDRSKELLGRDVYDLALGDTLISENRSVITNDFYLKDRERIFVVTGPNQGGKTTFARTLGQLSYLASIGCLVPGKEARLFLLDKLFTHFERNEDIRNLNGKLEDDLLRIHLIFEQATGNSILIMNESFLSTTLHDALFLSRKIMQRIVALDMLCVSVTFLDE